MQERIRGSIYTLTAPDFVMPQTYPTEKRRHDLWGLLQLRTSLLFHSAALTSFVPTPLIGALDREPSQRLGLWLGDWSAWCATGLVNRIVD